MQLSILATRKVKLGKPLEATIELNMPKALAGLGSFYSPVMDPDQPVDLMATYDLQRKKMAWCRENVILTDLAHQAALGRQGKYIILRDNLAKSLYGQLVDIRRICLGVLSDDEFVELGLGGAVSQDPVTMVRQGMLVRQGFTRPDLELRSPVWVRMNMEAGALLGDLDSTVQELDAVLTQLDFLRRVVQSEAAAKRKALDDFDESYLLVGRSVEACFRMAGMKEEADRVRQASRRLTQSDDDEEPIPEPLPEEEPKEETEVPEDETPEATDADGTPDGSSP